MYRGVTGAVGLAIVLMTGQQATQAAAGAGFGLGSLFDLAAGVVRDTNDDGLADQVVARVILPAAPTDAEIEAAVNLAARLGYETTALSLPLVLRDRDVTAGKDIVLPILVGAGNHFVKEAVSRGTLDVSGLQPGQGLVATVASPLGGPHGIAIVGADDEGTLAAALQVAARLPRAWSMSGLQLPAVAGHVADVLRGRGVVAQTSIVALVVDRERRGLASVRVRAEVTAGDVSRAAEALQDVDRAHARGGEPHTLNYANVAETHIDLATAGVAARRVVVRRSGLNPRTLTPPIDPDELAPDSPGDRGRAAEATESTGKSFDLRTLYTLSGWYGDAYADLIPDRTDTTLVLGDGDDVLPSTLLAARLGRGQFLEALEQRVRELIALVVGRPADLARELGGLRTHAGETPWVRLHYVYPYPHVDELIPLMAEGAILPYLDVPLQHGSPRILKSMKRPAAAENTLARLQDWRRICPELTLRSTFIVGFPGETETDFEALLDFLTAAQLDRVGAFTYSPVEGAAANELPGTVPDEVREERRARLMDFQEDISTQRLEARIDREMTVLVDEVDEEGALARSPGDAPEIDGLVIIPDAEGLAPGDFVRVRITDCDVHDLYAERLD